jgi:transcriptional regulator with XRE-family HTH domain
MAVRLADKLEHLRTLEGQLRGLGRSLSKAEMARAMRDELGEALSVPYLSQIESGTRPHLTAQSRELLARFFRVHPGYLVSDPEGFAESLSTPLQTPDLDFGEWLVARAEEHRQDPEVYQALLRIASQPEPREALLAFSRALGRGTPDG